jgi:hypothetical protein
MNTSISTSTSSVTSTNITTQDELTKFFNIKFYDERHGEPELTEKKMSCQYVNTYSENHCLTKQILDNIKNSHISQENMEKLNSIVNNRSYDVNNDDLINDLINIIFCLNEKLKK